MSTLIPERPALTDSVFPSIGNYAASSKRTGNRRGRKAMKNEGTADRVIRVVIGIALLCLLFLLHVHGTHYWFGWLGLIGLVPLLTGLVGGLSHV